MQDQKSPVIQLLLSVLAHQPDRSDPWAWIYASEHVAASVCYIVPEFGRSNRFDTALDLNFSEFAENWQFFILIGSFQTKMLGFYVALCH